MKSSVAKRGNNHVWEDDATGIIIFFSVDEEIKAADVNWCAAVECSSTK